MIVPGVRTFPGFVSGHWMVDREAAESLVLLTYDSLAAAEAMSEGIHGNADNQRRIGLARRAGSRPGGELAGPRWLLKRLA